MIKPHDESSAVHTEGHLIHWASYYDLLVGIITLGREHHFRRRIIEAAELRPGARVLDVGCGTGTLALAAAACVGAAGRVEGIDPSPEMVARARAKAAAAGLPATFRLAAIEALPFPDRSFDAVLSSLMFHHLSDSLKQSGLAEIRRVLAPGGRLTIIDFVGAGPFLHKLATRFANHFAGVHSHPGNDFEQLALEAKKVGFGRVATAPFRPRFLHRLSAESALDG
ncbi:MAG: class I SAM-dependent methyltransferase [Woeseia sp.]